MPRRHLNIRGKSANLPAITDRDWLDIKFGVDVGVDYYALSFVRNAEVIYELKHWLAQQGAAGRPRRVADRRRPAVTSSRQSAASCSMAYVTPSAGLITWLQHNLRCAISMLPGPCCKEMF